MEDFKNWHPNFPVDLQNCADEPIHVPGAVQEFGILIGLDPAGRVVCASENAIERLPELRNFANTTLQLKDLLTVEETGKVVQGRRSLKKRLVRVFFNDTRAEGQPFWGAIFKSGETEILEIEILKKELGAGDVDNLDDIPQIMGELQSISVIRDLAAHAAHHIKQVTGFDRVMVYQFDDEYNGEVIAEERESRLEPFLGLHFPAADIPAQARELYRRNLLRIIPTIDYTPKRIVPETHQSLDLSDSTLRSVSPIHIKYLRNMGVGASMSISLVVEGKLWGLIACHHYGPHIVPLNVRFRCEAFAQMLAWQIKSIETSEALLSSGKGEATLQEILASFSAHDDFDKAAAAVEQELLNLFNCTAIVLRLGEEVVELGKKVDPVVLNCVAKLMLRRSLLEPLVTVDLSAELLEFGVTPDGDTAGVMALPLAARHNHYIVCVRPEVTRTINWAGNPHEKFDALEKDERLQPRGSFALWRETHRGRSAKWSKVTVDLLKRFGLLFVKLVIERKAITEKALADLRNLNQAKDEFVAMVSHELRTPLNAIIGWTELSLSGELGVEKYVEAFKVIQRNARSQNQLVSDLLDLSRVISGKMRLSVKNIRVSEIVESVILSFQPAAEAKSIKIIPHLNTEADSIIGDSSRVQQVVWNLLSNALKFSPKNSRIWVSVRRINSQVELEIKDQGVGIDAEHLNLIFGRFQQVDSSLSRKAGGLGLGLAISKHIVELHGGRIEAQSEGAGKGSTFRAYFPIGPVQPMNAEAPPIDDQFVSRADGAGLDKRLAGEVILIVEDEIDAARFLNLLLTANGAKTFEAHNGREAMEVLEKHCDIIGIVLSDVGMPEMDGYELMTKIRESKNPKIRSVCTVALTAFGRAQDRVTALRSGFDSYVGKPVMQDELLAVLESSCKQRKRERGR